MMKNADLHTVLSVLGKRIAENRRRLNLSQEQLAESAGLSRDHIAKIELGLKAPSLGTAISIAKALDTRLSDLLDEKAKLEKHAQELVSLLQTLTDSEVEFTTKLLHDTADYLKRHRNAQS